MMVPEMARCRACLGAYHSGPCPRIDAPTPTVDSEALKKAIQDFVDARRKQPTTYGEVQWPQQPANVGWRCPNCGAGLAPTTQRCSCVRMKWGL